MLKAYAKYGLKPLNADSILASVLGKRQDGSVTATPAAQDVEYTCPVSIGGQTLNLDFDTGSADL
jgi:aspergillopepsin I